MTGFSLSVDKIHFTQTSMFLFINPLHITRLQSSWETNQKNCFLLRIEIYSRVKKVLNCSVPQIGCIPNTTERIMR